MICSRFSCPRIEGEGQHKIDGSGELGEWFKPAVLKTADEKSSVSSNLTLSAKAKVPNKHFIGTAPLGATQALNPLLRRSATTALIFARDSGPVAATARSMRSHSAESRIASSRSRPRSVCTRSAAWR